MIVKTKSVYYCEFCKRHRLSRSAIEQHEPRCIRNPDRVCGWKLAHVDHRHVDLPALIAAIREGSRDVEWLRGETDGCPACMLAALVQAGRTYLEAEGRPFDYQAEVDRVRQLERLADRGW